MRKRANKYRVNIVNTANTLNNLTNRNSKLIYYTNGSFFAGRILATNRL